VDQLDPAAAAELRTLPSDLASVVARRLLAASLADDPEVGYQHAQEARRLAARVGIVRETTGIAAYRAGRWAEALAELRAARRLTGRTSYLPLLADSERALGRIDRALGVIAESARFKLDRATEVELRIVESGIRRDQGLAEAAVVVLQLPELKERRRKPWSARLFYAYADALLDAGRTEQAREWFARAAAADTDEQTDAGERFDELDDIVIDDLSDEDEDDWADDDGANGADADDLTEGDESEDEDEPEPADGLAEDDEDEPEPEPDEDDPDDEGDSADALTRGDEADSSGTHSANLAADDLAADDLADDDQPL
jgi:tetratricopeptide (TPR) repeat protein